MDPLRICLALGPMAVYLLVLGVLNLTRRPFLVSGGRDLAALGLALTGLIVIGPIELFLPEDSMVKYGSFVWVMVLTLYGLWMTMIILMLRPRLVIYNITMNKLRPILADVVERLDSEARWAADSLVLPGLGVQLYLDSFSFLKNVSLKSVGGRQNIQGWKKLENALSTALNQEVVARNPFGLTLLGIGTFVAAAIIATIVQNPQALSQSLSSLTNDLLQLFH